MPDNQTLAIMNSHASTRHYSDRPVEPEVLDQIIDAAMHGPTSINSQEVSLIITEDPKQRKKIAEYAGNQPWVAQAPVFITLVLDLYKTSLAVAETGQQQVIQESIEGFGVGAVDVGIVLGNLMTAARSMGLSIVPIGGIRLHPKEMIELLDLPKLTFPLVGLSLGYSDHPGVPKPRLPRETFVHRESYHREGMEASVQEYNQTLKQHWQKVQREDGDDWSTTVTSYYDHIYFPDVLQALKDQGFSFEK